MTIWKALIRGSLRACVCAFVAGSATAALAQDKVTFTASTLSLFNMPVYVADVMGHFTEQKIAPEITVLKTGGSTALAAVLGGNANVYIGAPSSALSAASRGVEAVVIGSVLNEVSIDLVMRKEVAEQAGLTDRTPVADRFRALKGKKIGVTGSGSGSHQVVQYALRSVGLDPERDTTIVFVGGLEELRAALPRLDATVSASPLTEDFVRSGAYLMASGPGGSYEALKGMPTVVLVATKRWASAVPERTTRLLAAIASAQRDIHDRQARIKARDLVYAKYFPQLEKALYDAAWETITPAIPTDPAMPADALRRSIDFLREFSDQKYSVDPDKVYTNAYLPKS
ncbi:NitT/TauT family transport system substrate-binding protein [Azospirillum lipoferum]|uniref:ABC transporter substrate-binding protein n=1 Tax=Azospirillum lipoferum TaxID=193 RepID=A0A5A9GE84_AZOLI|nr:MULTISPECIES: ABC transporter substrate-binding protein [Azospirillum]KAA0592726.1 ABC transporter substrate-binding protein [Azospirillum lipoferum]MCP1614330.1 NitT/TauT family transport system substrate-binding protein [Azospirillum lipoferum]MDW5531891.1 ABC transporter substrate-binding protein [Azospirillum sp. NL1]